MIEIFDFDFCGNREIKKVSNSEEILMKTLVLFAVLALTLSMGAMAGTKRHYNNNPIGMPIIREIK